MDENDLQQTPDLPDDSANAPETPDDDFEIVGDTDAGEDEHEDDDGQPEGEAQTPQKSRAQSRIERTRKELRETKARLQALEAQIAQRPPASVPNSQPDPDMQRLADPNISDLERWQIQTNMTLRQQQQQTQMMLAEARNTSDRTEFKAMAAVTPILKRYEDRVEAEVQRMRSQNQQVPPRAAIADYLMGKDLREGKLKPRAAKSAAAEAPRVANNGRGRPTGARSDVAPSRGQTEAQRREARLLGKPI